MDARYSASCLAVAPDFVKLAESYGAQGQRVERRKDLPSALKWLVGTKGPAVLDCCVEREENVYPMVPAGAAISEMLFRQKKKSKRPLRAVKGG